VAYPSSGTTYGDGPRVTDLGLDPGGGPSSEAKMRVCVT